MKQNRRKEKDNQIKMKMRKKFQKETVKRNKREKKKKC